MFLSALSFVFGHALPSRAEEQLMPVDAETRGHVWITKGSGSSHNIWSQVKDLKGREGTPEGRKDLGRSPVLPLNSCLGKEGSRDVWSMAWAALIFTMCHAVRGAEGKGKAPRDQSCPIDTKTQTLRFPLRFSVHRQRLFRYQTATGPANIGGFLNFCSPLCSSLLFPLWSCRCQLPHFLSNSSVLLAWTTKSRDFGGLLIWWFLYCFNLLWRWLVWRELDGERWVRNNSLSMRRSGSPYGGSFH